MTPSRSDDGLALDATDQSISERPALEDEADDVVYASDASRVVHG